MSRQASQRPVGWDSRPGVVTLQQAGSRPPEQWGRADVGAGQCLGSIGPSAPRPGWVCRGKGDLNRFRGWMKWVGYEKGAGNGNGSTPRCVVSSWAPGRLP